MTQRTYEEALQIASRSTGALLEAGRPDLAGVFEVAPSYNGSGWNVRSHVLARPEPDQRLVYKALLLCTHNPQLCFDCWIALRRDRPCEHIEAMA